MTYLRKGAIVTIAVFYFMLATAVSAQTPRPTPTNVGGGGGTSSDSDESGSIQGHVYKDVNGDGVCVNSGVAGEDPIQGVSVEFLSSDEATKITVTSGDDGGFGLFAAGQSYWQVSAKPEAGWGVTSENPQYVPVYPESLGHTGIDFCVAEGAGGGASNGVIVLDSSQVLLPEAGAAAQVESADGFGWIVSITAVIGLLVFASGIVLHRRQI